MSYQPCLTYIFYLSGIITQKLGSFQIRRKIIFLRRSSSQYPADVRIQIISGTLFRLRVAFSLLL